MYHEKMTSTKIREKMYVCMLSVLDFSQILVKKSSFLSRLQNQDRVVDIGDYEDF